MVAPNISGSDIAVKAVKHLDHALKIQKWVEWCARHLSFSGHTSARSFSEADQKERFRWAYSWRTKVASKRVISF
ncbi:hypothetical protein HAX54_026869 [Datura stramonium]|uniref:Uncharacterized protein n=1 Tax=Datura stramonium TaxID=4076 RepID=A0ABS8V1P5_DATST|nr:hypothetical protein [Datura stramonium]